MIAIKCPHCHVGLKVDEGKIPLGITSFKCPKCKEPIPVSLLSGKPDRPETEADTVLVASVRAGMGRLTVLPDADTPEQTFALHEGTFLIVSREHALITVEKNQRGGYKHLLSDNNSNNHTLYNSNYLEKGEIVVLKDNDEIIMGRTVIRFNE